MSVRRQDTEGHLHLDRDNLTVPASPSWALAYGIATMVASWFFVHPSMGLGLLGRRSPDGTKSPLSSLASHLFYGMGMAVVVALA